MTVRSTSLAPPARLGATRSRGPAGPLARRAFLDARVRTIAFAYIFAVYSWLQAAGYHSTYPTVADREAFAKTFAGNDAIRLFYGYPYDVVSVGGYSAWRVGGTLAIAAAAFGVVAAVRALRAEEEAGRSEIVLAGTVRRGTVFASAITAVCASTAVLWLAEFAGFVVAGLSLAGSAYLALGTVSVVPFFAGAGALASQLAPTRRAALGLAGAAVALSWLLRVVSDTVASVAWLRWASPLGWAEQLRPFAGPRPVVLLLPALTALVLLAGAARLAGARDVGTALFPPAGSHKASGRLLSSPTAQALRRQRSTLALWGFGVVVFAVVLGKVSTSISGAGISPNLQKDFARFGAGGIMTPIGYLSFVFIVFIFAVCLFMCSQVGAAREEEAGQQLETLLCLPVSRHRWLGGRLLLASVAAGALAVLSGALTWAGAVSEGVSVSLPRMLEAGANCLPVSLMFLGLSALAYAAFPRASSAISYTMVSVMFLWYLVGSVLGVPRWAVDMTPFKHIGLVPVQAFGTEAAVIMLVIGLAAAAGALWLFRRRDLLGS